MKDLMIVVVLMLCLVTRATCQLGAPVYVANWGSALSNGSTAETPVNSLQLAVSISNNVFVLTDLVGSQQCLPTIPTGYDQLRIQGYQSVPSIQVSCTGAFLSVSNRSLEIEIQSVVLLLGVVTDTQMIQLEGGQVVLRAENVQFTSSVPQISGWLSVATGAAAYLTQCSIGNNRSIAFPLIQTAGDSLLVVVNTSMIGSPSGDEQPCQHPSSTCVPEVVIGGGSALFDGCYCQLLEYVPSFYAYFNTSLHLIDSPQLFSSVFSSGNVTLPLDQYITTFSLFFSVLTVEPPSENAIGSELPFLALSNSLVYLPDIEVTTSQPIFIGNSGFFGSGRLLNLTAVQITGSVTFSDCPVSAVNAYIGQSLGTPALVTFIGAKGPSGADLVASVCSLDRSVVLQGALIAENLYVTVPRLRNGGEARARVQSYLGWSNSTITVQLTSISGFKHELDFPVLNFGMGYPSDSVVVLVHFEGVKFQDSWWRVGTNTTSLMIKAQYKNGRFIGVIAGSVFAVAALIGLSIFGFLRCRRSRTGNYESIPE